MDIPDIPEVDGRLAQAVSHPIRLQFLLLLADRGSLALGEARHEIKRRTTKGPSDVPLSQVGYHVSVLARFGVVELATRSTRHHGASFRATDIGERLILAIETSPEGGFA